MSRATSAIGRDVSITIFTASSLNSCVNFLRRSGILHPPFRAGLYWIRCPESPRHATAVSVRGGWPGAGWQGWRRHSAPVVAPEPSDPFGVSCPGSVRRVLGAGADPGPLFTGPPRSDFSPWADAGNDVRPSE